MSKIFYTKQKSLKHIKTIIRKKNYRKQKSLKNLWKSEFYFFVDASQNIIFF